MVDAVFSDNFEEAVIPPPTDEKIRSIIAESPEFFDEQAKKMGKDVYQMVRDTYAERVDSRVLVGENHQVQIRNVDCGVPHLGDIVEISIKRLDRTAILSRLELLHLVKGLGEEGVINPMKHWVVELLPAQSRVMDTANQYWLYCLPDGLMNISADAVSQSIVNIDISGTKRSLKVDGCVDVSAKTRALNSHWNAFTLYFENEWYHDWRHVQASKNAVLAPEWEALEIYRVPGPVYDYQHRKTCQAGFVTGLPFIVHPKKRKTKMPFGFDFGGATVDSRVDAVGQRPFQS